MEPVIVVDYFREDQAVGDQLVSVVAEVVVDVAVVAVEDYFASSSHSEMDLLVEK